MGRLVLARALTAQGDTETASALVRETWRNDSLPADVEKQVLERYSEFLTRADHKARMEKRLAALIMKTRMRAARRLGAADLAIAQARIALTRKGAAIPRSCSTPSRRRHAATPAISLRARTSCATTASSTKPRR